MQHIHIFVGTHAEVAHAAKQAIGIHSEPPNLHEVTSVYPELTHSILAVTLLPGTGLPAFCIKVVDQDIVEDKQVLSMYLKDTFEELVKAITGQN